MAGYTPPPSTPGGPGTDTTAIHDNVLAEISAVALKGTPASGDVLLIEDSVASNAKKRITVGSLPSGAPGGADTHVQYNDTGAFAGSADYTFDKTDLWTFGGSSGDVRITLGSDTPAAIVAGQHVIDFGASVGGAVNTADAVLLRFQGTGNFNVSGNTYYGWDTGATQLFLRLNNTHSWYFAGETSSTYEWQVGTATFSDRATNRGEMVCQFSTGVFQLQHISGGATRKFQANCNLAGTAATNASTLSITGTNIFAAFDLWEIHASGTTTDLFIRATQRMDLAPGGNTSRSTSQGIRLSPQNYMRQDTGGFFAFVDVMDMAFGLSTALFWSPTSGTGTGYVYGAGINANALGINTASAAGSAFYVYGADIKHTGSGTVGFWEYRNDGAVVSTMLLNGDILAGNYTGIDDQALAFKAGAQTGTGGGFDLQLAASAGGGAGAQDGGDVTISGGAGSGGGVEGIIEIQSNITTNLVNIHTIGTVANSFSVIVCNALQGGDNLTVSVEAGAQTSSGNGRELFLQGGDANTTGDGGDIRLTTGALAGAGAEGRVDFRNAPNVVAGPPSAGASSQVDPEGYVRVKVNGTDRTIAYYLDV